VHFADIAINRVHDSLLQVLRQNDMHEFFVALIEYFETLFKRSSQLNPENDAAAFFHRLFNLVSQNRISVEEFGYDQPAGDGSNVSDCVLMVMDPWNQRSLRNFLRFKFVEGETVDTYINRWVRLMLSCCIPCSLCCASRILTHCPT
jgi:hypothetical protein